MTSPPRSIPPKRILIVTGDCPSHPYACAKLGTVLAAQHDVTLAGPNGMALERLQAEAKRYNDSATAATERKIRCVSIGDVTTLVHCNVRPVVNAHEYSPFEILSKSLFDRGYLPYGIAGDFEQLMDDQVDTYDNLKALLPQFDLVYAIHTAAGTVCDALEALRLEGHPGAPPCIVFSSLPYNSSFLYKNLWTTPRSIVALPHVATYSSPGKLFESMPLPPGLLAYLILLVATFISYLKQSFWMILDTYHAERAWKRAGKRTDQRRAERGLPPVREGMRYYWREYPLLSVGGTKPFVAEGEPIAENATVVGAIRSTAASDLGRLDEWIERASVSKIVYAGFGTGTQLSEEEAANLAKLANSLADTEYTMLLSLTKGSQKRLQDVFDRIISKPTMIGNGFLEYMNGKLRIDDDVPQESLLLSNFQSNGIRVHMFVSHLGFGSYTEAVFGGVPLVAYAAGCDQWFNTERAVEAGVAVRAEPGMQHLDETVREALRNEPLRKRARQFAAKAAQFDSIQTILDMAEEVCDKAVAKRRGSAASTCSTSTGESL
ncbi:hypothetical protein ACHAXT_008548 [Thalassiosira profunda]